MKELQINEQIRESQVRLIGDDGTQYGIISISEAKNIAADKNLDLCKVADARGDAPATCKLMDYNKYRYEQSKREKEAKKNQKVMEIKELRLSPVIDIGDMTRLANQAQKFISEGNKVKASIKLKGRQQAHPEIAVDIMKKYIELVGPSAIAEKQPLQEGKFIFAVLASAPNKK